MSRLLLLRHAKAARAEPGLRDFDRPLTAKGRLDADAVGARMAEAGLVPGLVLCSSAARTRQTWEAVSPHLGGGADRALFLDALYSADAGGYLDVVRSSGETGTILVIGHNPMVEEVTLALCGSGEAGALADLSSGFPTSGLAVILFAEPLAGISPGAGHLELFS